MTQTFYRLVNTGEKVEWVKNKGDMIKIDDYTFFWHLESNKVESGKDIKVHHLIEEQSGNSFGKGTTKKATKTEVVEKYGKSPIRATFNPLYKES